MKMKVVRRHQSALFRQVPEAVTLDKQLHDEIQQLFAGFRLIKTKLEKLNSDVDEALEDEERTENLNFHLILREPK